jgi:curli biogenesis system outer membrane secretion channel CsgG
MAMRTHLRIISITFLCAALLSSLANAQRKVVAVSEIKTNPGIEDAAKQAGTLNSLQRVAEAIDGQFINALNATRKFEISVRSDLDAMFEEASLGGNAVNVAGSDYIIVPVIDDFQDVVQRAVFGGIGEVVEKRKIRLGMVARIYDSSSGRLVEATSFQLDNKAIEQQLQSATSSGSFSDALLRQISELMAVKMANRVVDVIHPAKIIALTGKQVTINRGDGTGVLEGQEWEIFALGEEMIDPDTGESLGSSEVMVGLVRIQRITPRFSTAIIAEDYGIVKGAIARSKK